MRSIVPWRSNERRRATAATTADSDRLLDHKSGRPSRPGSSGGPGSGDYGNYGGTGGRQLTPATTNVLPALAGRRSARVVARSLFALTKPRIIELLLVTTIPTMLLAQRGLPS